MYCRLSAYLEYYIDVLSVRVRVQKGQFQWYSVRVEERAGLLGERRSREGGRQEGRQGGREGGRELGGRERGRQGGREGEVEQVERSEGVGNIRFVKPVVHYKTVSGTFPIH